MTEAAISSKSLELADVLRNASVAQFLFAEARAVDEHRYDDWLALWEPGRAKYWLPYPGRPEDPERYVSIILDDFDRLSDRVTRLRLGLAPSSDPPAQQCRTVSNIEVLASAGEELRVNSTFVAIQVRYTGAPVVWSGRQEHVLVTDADGAYKIAEKTVRLVNAAGPLPIMTFLI